MHELPLTWDMVEPRLREVPGLVEHYESLLNNNAVAAGALAKASETLRAFREQNPHLTDAKLQKPAPDVQEAMAAFARGNPTFVASFISAKMHAEFEKLTRPGKPPVKGAHFFLVEFDPGETLMACGMHSDDAGLLVAGQVRVLLGGVLWRLRRRGRKCLWERAAGSLGY